MPATQQHTSVYYQLWISVSYLCLLWLKKDAVGGRYFRTTRKSWRAETKFPNLLGSLGFWMWFRVHTLNQRHSWEIDRSWADEKRGHRAPACFGRSWQSCCGPRVSSVLTLWVSEGAGVALGIKAELVLLLALVAAASWWITFLLCSGSLPGHCRAQWFWGQELCLGAQARVCSPALPTSL